MELYKTGRGAVYKEIKHATYMNRKIRFLKIAVSVSDALHDNLPSGFFKKKI